MRAEEVEALQTRTARDRAMHAVEIREREDTRPGIGLLQPTGLLLIAVATVWLITFYPKGGGIGGAWECLLYSAGPCLDTIAKAEATGSFAYRPFLMWIGLALLPARLGVRPKAPTVAPARAVALVLP